MSGHLRRLLLIAFCVIVSPSQAGEQIVGEFRPGMPQSREVLAHVPVKMMVAEFIDPQATGLGKSLGYMLWREALTAVHDQRGAGIIYAHTAGDTPLADLLRQDYHLAAQEIARNQKSRAVMWGAVAEERGQVYIDSYLTLLPELIGESLTLTLQDRRTPLPGLATEISRSRYGFAQIRMPRAQLFRRAVVTRVTVKLRSRPSRDAAVVGTLPAHTARQAVDMHGAWFQVELDDGGKGWLNINQVDLPPRRARIHRSRVNIRSGPRASQVLRNTDLRGEYPVLDSRYVPGDGVWYQLQFAWGKGWVAARLGQPRFTLPAIQFMAGLQRYQLKNYRQAAVAFGRFVTESRERGNNVNLAAALALKGSSLLMWSPRAAGAQEAISQAVTLTPYDPLVYNLSMLATLYDQRISPLVRSERMVADLAQSLELDPRNPRTRTLLQALAALSRGDAPAYRALHESFMIRPATRERLEALEERYLDDRRS